MAAQNFTGNIGAMTVEDFINFVATHGVTAGGFEVPENALANTPPILLFCVIGADVRKVKEVLKAQLNLDVSAPAPPSRIVKPF